MLALEAGEPPSIEAYTLTHKLLKLVSDVIVAESVWKCQVTLPDTNPVAEVLHPPFVK
jgi:hypothetical protein